MRDSVREYLRLFPGDERKALLDTAPHPPPAEKPEGSLRIDLRAMRNHPEFERVRVLAKSKNGAATEFLVEVIERLRANKRLCHTEAQYLANGLSDILEGHDAYSALLLKKGRGREREHYRQIVADLEVLRLLGKSLNKARRHCGKKYKVSIDTVKRAAKEIRAANSVGLRTDPQEIIAAKVARVAMETGSFVTACKAVGGLYATSWYLVCLHMDRDKLLSFLGAQAVRDGSVIAEAEVDKSGLRNIGRSDIKATDLDGIQRTIGLKYIANCAQNHSQAGKLYQTCLVTDYLPESIDELHGVRHLVWKLPSDELQFQIAAILPGFAPPYGLSFESRKRVSLYNVLIAFSLYSQEEEVTQEQWRIAEEIQTLLRTDIYDEIRSWFLWQFGPFDDTLLKLVYEFCQRLGLDPRSTLEDRIGLLELEVSRQDGRLDELRKRMQIAVADPSEMCRVVAELSLALEGVRRMAADWAAIREHAFRVPALVSEEEEKL